MTPMPAAEAEWRMALGPEQLESHWLARFATDIAVDGQQPTVARWAERLAPGFAAAAAHGVIRTAHAARSLSRFDTPVRRAELAAGLALWASSWQALPGAPLEREGLLGARDALRAIPLVPSARRRNQGSITAALGVLADHPGFAGALGALDRALRGRALAWDLAGAFARVFLDQVHAPLAAIVFTHALTGVAAAQRLGRLVDERVAESLLAHAWQTGAALYACYAEADAGPDPVPSRETLPAVDELVAAAVDHRDEHAIKLAEACVDFHAQTADPVFLAVAWRAIDVLPRG